MKFIQGRKLKDAIAGFHEHKPPLDCFDNLEFRRLLETFVSICNVVAYAHSKGVLHRDIKPDNVMLGSYGETMVVDWGLAKVIGEPDEDHGSYVRLSGNGSTATQDGAIVGSPYYMSPEGAEGHPEAVDQASDVFLLGATLYEILTAKPPRDGSSSWELIDQARRCQPTSPRKINPRISRSLEAICMKAMAFEKKDRYATPLALAEDVERYLAGAAVDAYSEPLPMRIARWARRHRRRIVQSLTAACVIFLGLLAMNSYRQVHLLAERDDTRQKLDQFYRLADEAQFFAANTDAILERAPYYHPRRAQTAGEAALAIASPWGDQAERLPLPDARATLLRNKYDLLLLLARTELQSADRASDPHRALKLLEQARQSHAPSRGYYELRGLSLSLLGEGDAAVREQQFADHSDTLTSAQDQFLAGELLRLKDAGAAAEALSDEAQPTREHLDSAVAEYRRALQLDPQHYWARYQLGRCLLASGHGPEAVEALSACIALRPATPWAYATRGLANALSSQPQAALNDLNEAVRLDSDFQPARLNRGMVHWLLGDAESAVADFNAVLAAPSGQRLIEAAFYRGQLLLDEEKNSEAVADFTQVIDHQRDFSPAYWLRAMSQFRRGNFTLGLADVENFLSLHRNRSDPGPAAQSHLALGTALRRMAQQLKSEARDPLLARAADELQTAIAAGPPTAQMWQHLGAVHELRGAIPEAVDAYSHGLEISATDLQLRNMRAWAYVSQKNYDLAEADFAKVLQISPANAEAHAGLGFVVAELGRNDVARHEASAALLAADDNHLVLHNVACIYSRLSETDAGRKIEHENLALAALERACDISRNHAVAGDGDELTLIRKETAFPTSLRARPEFKRLLEVDHLAPRN
jgi:tetratricopeptide (TPR) repeat protein